MSFKDISYLQLWQPFCSTEQRPCAILVDGIRGTISVQLFNFGQVFQEKLLLKDISYLQLWWPFCSVEWNHLCNW